LFAHESPHGEPLYSQFGVQENPIPEDAINKMNIFICTKPIQIIIATIISSKYKKNILIVTKTFFNAENSLNFKILYKFYSKIYIEANRSKAIKLAAKLNPKNIFIDSDVGLKTQKELLLFKIRNFNSKINVYEEGIGTYRQKIINSVAKIFLYKITGTAYTFGRSILTSKIFVFDKEKLEKNIPKISKKIIQIDTELLYWIQKNEKNLESLFFAEKIFTKQAKDKNAHIYLSNWKIDEQVLSKISNIDHAYVKPHPHLNKKQIEKYKNKFPNTTWINPSIPAEITLLALAKKYKTLYVIHDNSSAAYYTINVKNIYSLDKNQFFSILI
jgi:hypothetical protein